MSYGIDISHWQPSVDYAAVKETKDFVYIKSSQGDQYVDPSMDTHCAGCQFEGLTYGLYHFADTSKSATLNAQIFARIVRNKGIHGSAFLPPCLDFEAQPTSDDVGWIVEFWSVFDTQLPPGARMLYANSSWFRGHSLSRLPVHCYFWVASWGRAPGNPSYMDARTVMHQYSNSMPVAGIHGGVDQDFAIKPISQFAW